jgi:sortase (surface protein transpeptidase)
VVNFKKVILKTFLTVFCISLIFFQITVFHYFNSSDSYKYYNQKIFNSSLKKLLLSTKYVQNENINISNNIENYSAYKNKVFNVNNVLKQDIEYDWYIEIPKIELIAEISEGTDQDILNKYVGHFEETSKLSGNVGLAAHNRGYKVNYFSRIKELEFNDEIFYYYNRRNT